MPCLCAMKSQYLSLAVFAHCVVASNFRSDKGASNFTGSPCAIVSQSYQAAAATAFFGMLRRTSLPSFSQLTFNAANPTVDAQLAYDCLTSVPLNSSDATELVTSILPYLEWQSGKSDPTLSISIGE